MAQTRKYSHQKDPRKKYNALRQSLRKKVFAASDTCAICGRFVDKTLPAGNPLAPELDEIVPVARGGSPYDLDNLQLVHRVCNQKKGAKMTGDVAVKELENPTPTSRAW